LADQKLFDRVIEDEPDVGVSVEILHLSSVWILVVIWNPERGRVNVP
jgi:hypothetical protein